MCERAEVREREEQSVCEKREREREREKERWSVRGGRKKKTMKVRV